MFFDGFGVTQPSPLKYFQPPDRWSQWFFDGFGATQPSPLTEFQPPDHCFQWFFNGFGVIQPSPFNDFQPSDHCFQWFFDGFQILDTNGQRWFLKIYTQKSALFYLSLMKFEPQYKTITHIYLG